MKKLTETEEKIMQILWNKKSGFVSHTKYGNTYEYFPVISKENYKKLYLKNMVRDYFDNSYQQLISFFAKEEALTVEELQDILEIIKKQKANNNE